MKAEVKGMSMSIKTIGQMPQQKRFKVNRKLMIQLTMAGGIVFWLTSIATSLLPIATAYRAAFSNWSIQTVWIGSLFMGMMIGCLVSYIFLRFFQKIPTKDPILKSVILSFITLLIAVLMFDVPMILQDPSASLYYFFIGIMFNTVRFLFLGIAVGCLYKRVTRFINPAYTDNVLH